MESRPRTPPSRRRAVVLVLAALTLLACLTPTAATAYSQVYAWLVGAKLSHPCAAGAGGAWTCALSRAGGCQALAVWSAGGAQTYPPAAGFVDYRDLAGKTVPLPAGAAVPIGPQPVLLESGPVSP